MEYTLVKTIEDEKAVIRVYSPVISDEERNRRYETIKKAAVALLKGSVK